MRLLPLVAILLAGCVANPTTQLPGGDAGMTGADGYELACEGLAGGNASWPESCLAFASPNDSPSKTEIDLAVNPLDPTHVVVGSKDLDKTASDCVWSVAQVSKDGGASWATSIIGGAKAARKPGDYLFGWECVTDPIMVFDDKGTLYYSLQIYDYVVEGDDVPPVPVVGGGTVGSAIALARSKDGGATWDKIITQHAGEGNAVFHDYMRMAFNPKTGSVYTIWNQFTQPAAVVPVLVASRDRGETAAPPVYIPVREQATGVVMSGLAVATDGTVYVMLNDGGDAYFTTSTDDARTFSTPVKVATHVPVPRMMKNNTYRSGSGFELAVDNSGGERDGCIYATFADYVDEDADINVIASCDQGKTWTEPVQVNTGHFARGDQWMERPVVDRKGTLHLVYFDKSRDPENYGMDVTWARSADGGVNWTIEHLTQRAFDPSLGIHQDGFPFIGDYNGIGTAGDWLYMAFPTTITGRAEIAVAKVKIP